MAGLNVDVFALIDLVRERPAIWDRRSDLYKDRRHTKLAWREVCTALVPDFENYNENEQFEIGKHLLGKWTNLRDNFIKSNKKIKQSMQSSLGINKKRRKYIFYDQLSFLEQILDDNSRLDLNPSPPSFEDTSLGSTSKQLISPIKLNATITTQQDFSDYSSEPPTDTPRFSPNKRKKLIHGTSNTTNANNSSNNLAESILEILQNHSEPDPDQSFFNSILPLVKNFCEDEKLEFRMEVLKLIKNMKAGKRKI